MFKSKRQNVSSSVAGDTTKNTLHENMNFSAREKYKMLRTSLSFTLPDGINCPIIGITSSIRGEGKSTTAVNLAYALAEEKKRILLIDADLRIPSIAKKMQIKNTPGLTNMLIDKELQRITTYRSGILENWEIIPSGDIPPNPSELLGSEKMEKFLERLRKYYDYIIIDLPPVNVVTDALAISKLLSGMVLVIREHYTDKSELRNCVRQLELSDVNVLGCVMNATRDETGSYGKYRRYGKSYKYYSNSYYKDTK